MKGVSMAKACAMNLRSVHNIIRSGNGASWIHQDVIRFDDCEKRPVDQTEFVGVHFQYMDFSMRKQTHYMSFA